MKHKSMTLSLLALAVLSGAAVRFWNLGSAMDEAGLPLGDHPATLCMVALSVLFALIFLLLSFRSPGRGTDHTVLVFSPLQQGISLLGAGLVAVGALLGLAGNGTAGLVLAVLGLLAGISMGATVRLRKTGNRVPLPELFPVAYLIIKLILNFKDWSTDPIILDYFDMLFALIFVLLALYHGAGFLFGKGKSRKTLFCACCACVFCPMAAVSGIMKGTWSVTVEYVGYLLWMAAMVPCLLTEGEGPQKAEKK